MNWLDILLVIIVGGSVLKGLRTGLLGGLSGLLGLLLGFAAALRFYKPLVDMVNLKWGITSSISGWLPSNPDASNTINGLLPEKPLGLVGELTDSLTEVIASGIISIVCFVLIFALVSWGVKTLGALLGTMAKLFFLGPVDRVGGAVLGAVNGSILATILVGLLSSMQIPLLFAGSNHKGEFIALALQKSVLVPFFIDILVILNVKFPGWGG